MIARTLHVDVAPNQIDSVVQTYRELVRPIHAQAAGLRRHYVLVDRDKGRVHLIGVWESAQAIADIAPTLEPARQRLWSKFGEQPTLEIYEVVDELAPG